MGREEIKRYIELEAPAIGIVENAVSELVCFRKECDERVTVDPGTFVPEDPEAVDVESKELGTDRWRCEIYCSQECRNEQYTLDEEPSEEEKERIEEAMRDG